MITVYRVTLDCDEYYGRDMDDVRWLLKVKAMAWLNAAPVTISINKISMSKAEFESLPEWGL